MKIEIDTSHLPAAKLYPTNEHGELIITRSQMTQMMLDSHRKASNTSEEIMCLKEIAKIQGHYDTKPTQVTINIEQHAQRLEVMSDEELLRLTGAADDLLCLDYEDITDVNCD